MRSTKGLVRAAAALSAAALLLALAGCVTASLSATQKDGVYTLWAQDGLAAVNWDRAERDAVARAQEFASRRASPINSCGKRTPAPPA